MTSATEPFSGTSEPSVPARAADTSGLQWAAAAGLLFLHAALAWSIRLPAIMTRNDDALYILLSRSVRRFHYLDSHLLGSPAHSQYPPGYPALLAVAGTLFGDRLGVYQVLGIAMSTLALALLFDAVRRLWSARLALLVLAAAALNIQLLEYAGDIVAEPSYLAFAALTIWALACLPDSPRQLIIAGGAAIVAAMIRSPGVTLLAALGVALLLRRRYREALAFGLCSGVTVGSWFLWTMLAPSKIVGRSYVADVFGHARGTALGRLQRDFWKAWHYVGVDTPRALNLPTWDTTLVDNILWVSLLVILGGLGLWACWRKWRVPALYGLFYYGLIVLWRWWSPRFLMPMIPLVVLMMFVGADEVGRRWDRRLGLGLLAGLGSLLILSGFRGYRNERDTLRGCDRARATTAPGCLTDDQRSFVAAAEFARSNTPSDAAFYTLKEATWAYYSGRRSTYAAPILFADSSRFLPTLRERGIDYVLLARTTRFELGPLGALLAAHCTELQLVKEFPPRTYLFFIPPASSPADSAAACGATQAYRADTTGLIPQRK